MDKYKVIIEESAQQDIRGIYEYIANTMMEPQIAIRLIVRIRKAIAGLNNMPERFSFYDKEPWRS